MKFQLFLALACAMVYFSTEVVIRQSGEMVVEAYFVVDNKALDIYKTEEPDTASAVNSMKADIEYFLTEVNKLFSSMQPHVTLSVRARKIDIMQTSTAGPQQSVQYPDLVAAHEALDTFGSWLDKEGSLSALNYDVAVLWTGYNLYNTSTLTAGYAYLGTVCTNQGIAVVEYDGTYSTVVNTAHEIAHNLGASHDGSSGGYVMSPSTSPDSINRWRFSLCSASDVMGMLSQITENCLSQTSPLSPSPSSPITPSLGDPHSLCRRRRGADSVFCTDLYQDSPKGDDVCKFLFCSDGGSTCSSVISSDGLVCGVGKTCQEGTCQTDTSSSAARAVTDESCLYGDAPSVSFNGFTGSCGAFLDQATDYYCESATVNKKCCKTCKERKSADSTCPYGDRNSVCSNYQPYQICGNANNAHICCATCSGYSGRKRRDVTGPAADVTLFAPPLSLYGDVIHVKEVKVADHVPRSRSHEPLVEL